MIASVVSIAIAVFAFALALIFYFRGSDLAERTNAAAERIELSHRYAMNPSRC